MRIEREVKSVLKKIKNYLSQNYGKKIKKIILYGSYARGEFREDSDIDILIVVENNMNAYELEEELSDILFDILVEKKKLVSLMVINEGLFESYKSPLFLNIKKEGVLV